MPGFPIDKTLFLCYIVDMNYPVHHEEPIIHQVPKFTKKPAQIEFFVDIEGTLINDLWHADFLPHNCDNIKEFIHKHDTFDYKVNIFTFGWTRRTEIEFGVIENLFNRIGIDKQHRGIVYVKEDAIDAFLNATKSISYDRNVLMQPGGFAEYGYTKPDVWTIMVNGSDKCNVLIDDTVSENDFNTETTRYVNPKNFKVVIRNSLDQPATLYTPDGVIVGAIMNESAFHDVCRQIFLQSLTGYYIMFNGTRVNIEPNGIISNKPDGLFEVSFKCTMDLMSSAEEKKSLLESFESIYPQTINPT